MPKMQRIVRGSAGALALAFVLGTAAGAGAQGQEQAPSEFASWRVPGWSFTPGVSFGTQFDSNVAIAGRDEHGNTASDKVFLIQPSGQLEFFSPRTSFSTGYRGSLQRYFELSALDTTEHRGFLSLRHRVSRRVTLYANDEYSRLPTTDLLQLNGLPFLRVGSRYNSAGAGLEARVTKSLDWDVDYETSWVDFLDKNSPLTGGILHGIHSSLTHRFTDRFSLGGEYGFRWADLNDGARQFTYQDAGVLFQFMSGEHTRLEASGGMTHLTDRNGSLRRTSPYARFGITHRAARATLGGEFRRSYAPSFFLGGSHLSDEARAYVDMPFSRNRFYIQESAAWRRTHPVVNLDPALDSIWVHSTLGYAIQRWLRVEGYHAYTTQDNRLAGGRITRHLVGVQMVVSEPMRIR